MTELREINEAHWAKKTRNIYANSQAQHLDPFFGRMFSSEISADDIAKYQSKRHKEKASNRSINIEVGLLRLALKKARLWAHIADDVKMLKENKDIGRELSDDEQHRWLVACKASASRSLYPAVLTSIHTGLRNQELRLLKWRQVDFLNCIITVGKSKTVAGVECRWHDMRHSFVSLIAAGGATDGTIRALAGWMSPKMIERYSHVRNQAKQNAIAVLDKPGGTKRVTQ